MSNFEESTVRCVSDSERDNGLCGCSEGSGDSDEALIERGDGALIEELNFCVDSDSVIVDPPQLGMIFNTWEEGELYYNAYGKQQGFGVVRAQSAYKKGKVKRAVTWRCHCYGQPDRRRKIGGKRVPKELEGEPVAVKKSKKLGCGAYMYAALRGDGKWEVKRLVLDHTHVATPSKSMYVSKYRLMELEKVGYVRRRLKFGEDVGIGPSKIHTLMASERNGVENVKFTKKDLHNLVSREKKLKLENGDTNAMMEYFKMMQKNNRQFYHMHRLDSNGVLQDVLWVDARSRAAYEDFGDVVCFDTTFLLNKYDLPFANVVGVNHHGQTILLGCALISHEDTDTFKWVFSTWLDAVGGVPPAAILTDQDPAMRKALKMVMPETRHRWCLWHIVEKFGSKLGKCKGYLDFKDELKNIIYGSLYIEEYELRWKEFIVKHGLENNSWLSNLYDEREMWVPAAMKHIFWAGMKTTQRSESIHNFFDEFFRKNTGLCEFAEKYVAAMEQRMQAERLADGNSAMYLRCLVTDLKIEETFRKVYTDSKFMEVQRECKRLMYCNSSSMKEVGDGYFEHLVDDRVYIWSDVEKKEKLTNKRRQYRVLYYSDPVKVECECKLFECSGILCRHCIKVFEVHEVEDVPGKYIVDRWRKDIQRKHTRVKVAYHDMSKTVEVVRFDKLMSAFEPVGYLASEKEDSFNFLLNGIKDLELKVKESLKQCMPRSSVGEGIGDTGNRCTPASVNRAVLTPESVGKSVVHGVASHSIKDPTSKRGRGCVRATRFMTTVEQARREKEDRRKKYEAKRLRVERGKRKAGEADSTQLGVVQQQVEYEYGYSIPNSTQVCEDTVGNGVTELYMPLMAMVPSHSPMDVYVPQANDPVEAEGVRYLNMFGTCVEAGEGASEIDGQATEDELILRNGVQWG